MTDWTPERLFVLRDLTGRLNTRQIARKLRTSERMVRNKQRELGLVDSRQGDAAWTDLKPTDDARARWLCRCGRPALIYRGLRECGVCAEGAA